MDSTTRASVSHYCSIIPPHMLQAIAASKKASNNSRDIANKTLARIASVRQTRLQTQEGTIDDQSHPQPQGIVPGHVFQGILKSDSTSKESKERAEKHLGSISDVKAGKVLPDTAAARGRAMRLFRRLYDSQQSNRRPGKNLFSENDSLENADPYAIQVYNNFGSSFNFFSKILERNSIDDNGMDLIGSVHYDDDNGRTPGYDNAFWYGKQMCFGDGDPEIFNTFTESLDITGHELTHGVTAYTANLPYEYQSGALNESISDVFGSMIKQYNKNPPERATDADWLIGKGLFRDHVGARALRDMARPGEAYTDNDYVGSDPQPKDMDGYKVLPNTQNGDWGGVHINSGIPNRAFYLAATSVGDYSWEPAGRIWYAALTDPALKNVDTQSAFEVFANLTIKHAKTVGTDAQTAVENAWKTVKVLSKAQAKREGSVDSFTSTGLKMDSGGIRSSHVRSHVVTPYLPSGVIAETLSADRREQVGELREWIASMSQSISLLFQIKLKFPATTEAEAELSELQGKIDMITEANDLVSKLEETIPAIVSLIHSVSRTYQGKFPDLIQELKKMVGRITNIWSIRFFTDLNDFCELDNPIDSVLTVTGSSQDAFADTAARYVNWHWGQRGTNILNWLSKFLLTTRSSRPNTPHTLRINGNDEGAEPVCIELQGQLNDKSAVPLSKCNVAIRVQWIGGSMENYYTLVAEVASQLAWIVAAFREPPEESISFTRAKIEDAFQTGWPSQKYRDPRVNFRVLHYDDLDLGPGKDNGTCWHQPFTGLNVAVGFPIPRRPDGMRGVELPFPLMTTFADVGYAVEYKGGLVLKGWHNALFPVRIDSESGLSSTTSAIQWHLFSNQRHRLYMAEADGREPSLVPIKTKLFQVELGKVKWEKTRHFLGLYEHSRILIGTNDSQADIRAVHIDDSLRERRLLPPIAWNRVFDFGLGVGALGVTAGLSTGIRILKKKERQQSRKVKGFQRDLIKATQTNSTVLYDTRTKIAWMLPQICVVMHLVQAWVKQNYPKAQINYPAFDKMDPSALDTALQQFWGQKQNAAEEAHINLREAYISFAQALDQLQDNEDLKPANRSHAMQLAGVDFAQLARRSETFSILTLTIDPKSSGDWLKVLKSNWEDDITGEVPYRVVTLFCGELNPQPIVPRGPVCNTWFPPPVGQDYLIMAMHCLGKLAQLHGKDPVMLSREHYWKRGCYTPYQSCSGRSCNRLQKITNKRCKREDEVEISKEITTADANGAVVFGGIFNIYPQKQCISVNLQQQQPVQQ